ncbi:MAG: metallophosphoesterase [Candidatus Helarchaeota archaeon]|nr:metallophosphoesterase [Candidatus Helarchaeota archaeon]
MKILAFSDFHGLFGLKDHYIDVKKKIKQYQPDLLLLCGDLQDRGSIRLLENRIQNLEFSPIFYVFGNSEEQLNLNTELKNAINIHLKIEFFNGIHFIGLGGDEFDVKRDIPEIRKLLSSSTSIKNLIIISHVPPFNTVDLSNDGRNVGVPEFRDLINENEPILVTCGHIHENNQKVAWIGSSMVCNVGPQGVLFTIENIKISTLMLD